MKLPWGICRIGVRGTLAGGLVFGSFFLFLLEDWSDALHSISRDSKPTKAVFPLLTCYSLKQVMIGIAAELVRKKHLASIGPLVNHAGTNLEEVISMGGDQKNVYYFRLVKWWICPLLLLYRVNYRQEEELFKHADGVSTRTVGYKLAMKKFSLKTRNRRV